MQPSHSGAYGVRENDTSQRRSPTLPHNPVMPPSLARRLRSEGTYSRHPFSIHLAVSKATAFIHLPAHLPAQNMYLPVFYADSWVEISSQPSSSSLSSAGGDHEIVTTGLQIRHDPNRHRQQRQRRLLHVDIGGITLPGRPSSGAGSSQDEYDESESESDQVLSSSNEELINKKGGPDQNRLLVDEDEGDDSTTLGRATSISDDKAFTPQPNAFSHPPSIQTSRQGTGSMPTAESRFPPNSSANGPLGARLASNQNSPPRHIQPPRSRLPQPQTSRSHSSSHGPDPSHTYQPDHDAALRASLSTLLSCAAAVRGSPKQQEIPSGSNRRRDNEPTALRLVPESRLFGPDHGPAHAPVAARKPRANSPSSSPSLPSKAVPKRKARESSKDRTVKKSRAAKTISGNMEEATASPLLMSWMISAGVVLVFSAISFSVGYAWGKEVGRFEAGVGIGSDGAGCGREAMRVSNSGGGGGGGGLRRLRWGTASSSVRA